MVMIGLKDVIIEASIAVVMVIAFRKHICVMYSPSIEATKVFSISFFSIFSSLVKKDAIQNRIVAPIALKQKRPSGEMPPSLDRAFVTIMLNPNMVYANRQDVCPMIKSFFIYVHVLPAECFCIIHPISLCFEHLLYNVSCAPFPACFG